MFLLRPARRRRPVRGIGRLAAILLLTVPLLLFGAEPAFATDKPRVDVYVNDPDTGEIRPCVRNTGPGGYVQYWCRDIVREDVGFPASEALSFVYARYGDTINAPGPLRDENGNNYSVYARGTLWEACHHLELDDIWQCHARAANAKVATYTTDAWDYYLGAMRSWGANQQRAVECMQAIYNVFQRQVDGSEWESCTGG